VFFINTIRVIKSRRMRWAGHVTCTGAIKNVYKILVRKLEGKKLFRKSRYI